MRLRFVEDWRTLVWAFVLFPLVPALAWVEPELLPWLVPLALYNSYCSGVISHNHNHCATFTSRRVNAFFGCWLTVFYGFPLFAWIPTHNKNHHRYVNGPGDVTRTTRHSRENSLWAALTYPLASGAWQLPSSYRYVSAPGAMRSARLRRAVMEAAALVLGHVGFLALSVSRHGVGQGSLVYAVAAGIPALLAPYWMMVTNYVQHVDCDPASGDDHSRNFTSPMWNWLTFSGGYHTVHHENPGTHWSRYRSLHEARAARIDPRLEVHSIFAYFIDTYFRRCGAADAAPQRAAGPRE